MAGSAKKRPKLSDVDVNKVLNALRGRSWLLAPDLENITGYTPRQLRQLANMAKGQIIGGQEGYKLTAHASVEERKHALNSLRSRITQLCARVDELEQHCV